MNRSFGRALLRAVVVAASCCAGLPAIAASERTLDLRNLNTGESLTVTYSRDGRYDPEGLERLNLFLRDWRKDEETRMDPALFDLVWEIVQRSGSRQPIQVHSGYRSRSTNAMLKRRNSRVAEHSHHINGKALDFHLPDVPAARLRAIAMRMQDGGVGFYPDAGIPFVHVDVGGIRHWPRMSRRELENLFPDGKTVHIPSDGKPLPGYELALAEIEGTEAAPQRQPNIFEMLFAGLAPKPVAPAEEPVVAPDPVNATGDAPGAATRKVMTPVPVPRPVIEGTVVARADFPKRVKTREDFDALFRMAETEVEDRNLPRQVLGYASLPVIAFMPGPGTKTKVVKPRVTRTFPPIAIGSMEEPAYAKDIWMSEARDLPRSIPDEAFNAKPMMPGAVLAKGQAVMVVTPAVGFRR